MPVHHFVGLGNFVRFATDAAVLDRARLATLDLRGAGAWPSSCRSASPFALLLDVPSAAAILLPLGAGAAAAHSPGRRRADVEDDDAAAAGRAQLSAFLPRHRSAATARQSGDGDVFGRAHRYTGCSRRSPPSSCSPACNRCRSRSSRAARVDGASPWQIVRRITPAADRALSAARRRCSASPTR